jgi:hypothetical protein
MNPHTRTGHRLLSYIVLPMPALLCARWRGFEGGRAKVKGEGCFPHDGTDGHAVTNRKQLAY